MNTKVLIRTIDTHTAGEPTRIITGGLDRSVINQECIVSARRNFAEKYDWLRKLLMQEPRGHDGMCGAVVLPPTRPNSDLGLFFIDGEGYLEACGHATMGVVNALVEIGQLPNDQTIQLDTPSGTVTADPEFKNGQVKSVSVQNIKSFFYQQETIEANINNSKIAVDVDIVYAGNVFALVNVEQLSLDIESSNVDLFTKLGIEIRESLNQNVSLINPLSGEKDTINITSFYKSHDTVDKNISIFGGGSVDRSPCGTGTCAKMTLMYESNELELNEVYKYEGILETQFVGRLRDAKLEEGQMVVTPEVTGSAYITGMHTFIKDPEDPVEGFNIY